MQQLNYNDLLAFLAVAREGSFTKAAAKLGVSQSALSQTIRALEERLGLRLLMRTTRSVSPTEAGEHMLRTIGPRFEDIDAELAVLSEQRLTPAGSIRITAGEHAAIAVIQPALARLVLNYPDIKVEVMVENGMTDIVAARYDAGVRLGDQVAKDMIAVNISAPVRMAIVASPAYFDRKAAPRTPHELMGHNCINVRLPTHGGLFPWEFVKDGQALNVRVEGQLIFNTLGQRVQAALAGLGIICIPEDQVLPHIAQGRLVRVLTEWCPFYGGYKLYYPSRRHPSTAFTLLVEALRYPPDT